MKIGIIGTGVVGQQLAVDLFNLGHEITIGTRDPQKLAEFSQRHPDVKLGDNAEAAQFGEWIVLATSWSGTQNAIGLAGPEHLSGKILIDITNPLDFSTGKPTLAVGHTTSAGELVQAWAPEAKVVKALNQVTAKAMLHPDEIGGHPDMFIAGNDAKAKEAVSNLLTSVGWGIVDLGDITMSRYLEPLAMIWITHFLNGGMAKSDHGFKLLRK